ncbi:MAG: SGNH/GDSL hydrolase family protein [Lentisphaeria bacterium]|jgi:hypothetical protein|nr:SGNH/GDSL hydrolase family protein [Lentisphaeria bacterium]
MNRLIVALAVLLGAAAMSTARERAEWCHIWWENAHDTARPRILLVGDSICNGYNGAVRKRLAEFANVDLLATSKNISDPALLKEMGYMLGEYQYAVVHFNHGLHGFGIPQEKYEQYLRDYVAKVKAMAGDAKLVWASITPLRGDSPNNAVIAARNEIAARVMQDNGIPVDDLHAVVAGQEELRSDNKGDAYHYNGKGYAVLAEAVSQYLAKLMGWELPKL